jgi:hypothetical protein
LRRLRSRLGEEPILFAGMSVSRTLPFGDADDVQAEIDYFVDATDGGRGLFLHTSNVTGVEVPADNIRCGYASAHSLKPPVRRERRYERWAWSERHPENPLGLTHRRQRIGMTDAHKALNYDATGQNSGSIAPCGRRCVSPILKG